MAARRMGTGTFRHRSISHRSISPRLLAFSLAAVVLAACGGSPGGAAAGGQTSGGPAGGRTSGGVVTSPGGVGAAGSQRSAFSWLHPERPPAGWIVVRIANGAELAYPPSWRRARGDKGTATAVSLLPGGEYFGYLNLTPRQGEETLSDWSSFRIEHNREEGDRAVRRLAAASGLHFLDGTGSCVKDSYMTETGGHFIEIACLVAGARAQSVIVGAAPPNEWGRAAGVIERAIEGLRS